MMNNKYKILLVEDDTNIRSVMTSVLESEDYQVIQAGTCTPIGASANIAGIGILRKAGYEVKTKDFTNIGIPFTFAAVIPAYIYLWLLYA